MTLFEKKNNKANNGEEVEYSNLASVDLKGYTLIDPTKHGRKLDLLTSVHMGSRHLDQARAGHKSGKAHWIANSNEQVYKPKSIKIDPQIEFIYEELGLGQQIGTTELGQKQVS